MTRGAALALAALLLGASLAAAQTPDPKACAPGDRLQAGAPNPSARPFSATGESLSDKLARTDGVICPPRVDPDIRVPAPNSGATMPVIPPPGGAGGDPSVRPK